MANCFERAKEVMEENFGHVVELCLASCVDSNVTVRDLNAYYENGKFYILSKESNSLIRDISVNPRVGLCHGSHNIYGTAKSLGHPLEKQNAALRKTLRKQFSLNYDEYVTEHNPEMRIVEVTVTAAETYTRYHRYEIDFVNQTASRDHTQPVYIYR
ncbi:MAG: hypothetical protein NC099_01940 [Corallococcus sp.]|nr:hypothetical protein [Bacillota bacterium]MCM1533392.1 hypothetical protein [Corallococcus sp.]